MIGYSLEPCVGIKAFCHLVLSGWEVPAHDIFDAVLAGLPANIIKKRILDASADNPATH